MKLIPVKESIGMIIAHDMTEIIPGKSKGAIFKKGDVIKREDIPRLLGMGKDHIGIIEYKKDDIHENEAAIRIARGVAGQGICISKITEGKASFIAKYPGLLKVNRKSIIDINSQADMMVATLHTDILVDANTVVGGTRIIPLTIQNHKLETVEGICKLNYPTMEILPLLKLKVGIITTGNEIFYGRITDKFGPVIMQKFRELGCHTIGQKFSKDDPHMIAKLIESFIEEGAQMVTITGGMSVDADDVTPEGIKKSGADIISYGSPVLPGAMFLLSYLGDIPVLGLPGCVMYYKRTIFDLIVPRLVAGERLTQGDIIKLGHGGLCSNCEICRYPNCGFGKG